MKVFVDTNKTFSNLIFLKSVDWIDFKTKKVKGSKIICGDLDSFRKIEVRVSSFSNKGFNQIGKNDGIEFVGLVANFWQLNGKSGITFSADKVRRSDSNGK